MRSNTIFTNDKDLVDFVPKLNFIPIKDRNTTQILNLVRTSSSSGRRAMTPSDERRCRLAKQVEDLGDEGRINKKND